MSILEKVFGSGPRKDVGDEKSSGGSALPKSQQSAAEGTLIFTDGLGVNSGTSGERAVSELAKPEVTKEEPLRRMDIFENPEGKRLVVQRIEKDGTVVYEKQIAKGVPAEKGAYLSRKPLKNFHVSVGVEGMEKIDPIREKDPRFYAEYEVGMERLAEAFIREFTAATEQVDKWSESLKEEGDIKMYDRLYEKIERIGNEWNELKDNFVEQGRRRIQLFAEFRLIEEEISKNAQGDFSELRKKYSIDDYAGLAELVEKRRLNTLLDRKVEVLQKKYDDARVGKVLLAEDAPSPIAFAEQVNTLFASIKEGSSSGDIQGVLDQLDVLEERVFVGENEGLNGVADTNGRRERKGKQVKRFRKGEPVTITEKKRAEKFQKAEWKPLDAAVEPVAIPVGENAVKSKEEVPPIVTGVPTTPPFIPEDTNTMPPKEIPAQKDLKQPQQELFGAFLQAFDKTFDDLRAKISGAADVEALKGLRHGGGKVKYKFFDLESFAEYFNNENFTGGPGKKEGIRDQAFKKIDDAEEELQKLYGLRREQFTQVAPKRPERTTRTKRAKASGSISRQPGPFDEDDAARNISVNGSVPDYEQAKYLARVETTKKAVSAKPELTSQASERKASSQVEKPLHVKSETIKERAAEERVELRTVIDEKKRWAREFFADPANAGKVTQGQYDNLISYLDKSLADAESAFSDGRYKRVHHTLEDARKAEFMEEKPEKGQSASLSEKPKVRTYEELEKASSKIERGQCASVVIEGLKPYMIELERGKIENPDLKLRDIIEHFGVDEVVKSFVPAITGMLSSEWKENERDLFALEFAKKEITGYFE